MDELLTDRLTYIFVQSDKYPDFMIYENTEQNSWTGYSLSVAGCLAFSNISLEHLYQELRLTKKIAVEFRKAYARE